TAGRFFEAIWLVKGNDKRTTSPNSKGIVDVVFRIAPDRGERRFAGCCRGTRCGTLLLAQPKEIDEILDFGDAVGRQGPNLVDQCFGIRHHSFLRSKEHRHSEPYFRYRTTVTRTL